MISERAARAGLGEVRVAARSAAARALGSGTARSAGARDLVLVVVVIVSLGRLVDGPLVWAVAAILVATTFVAARDALAGADPGAERSRVAIHSLALPIAAAMAALGTTRLVPLGLGLLPALAFAGWLVARVTATEGRLLAVSGGPGPADRSSVLGEALLVAFLAFVGVSALVPGALPEPGLASGGTSVIGPNLALLVAADAALAGILGYRLAMLRGSGARAGAWSAATYSAIVAIAATGVRTMEIPRLVGPALLALVFFLWDAVRVADPTGRRNGRRFGELAVLAILGVGVLVWSLNLRPV